MSAGAGMEKAQHLLPHPHMPSKTTMVLGIVMLHVVALTYLMFVLYRAARCACLLAAKFRTQNAGVGE